jgi:PadR family transcriptional regulator, regulatory protein PadR
MEFSQDLIRGSIVPIVLALLKDRSMYGYEILKLVNVRTNGRLEWKEGTLYPALHRLEADKLVKAFWQDAPADEAPGRKRKYYTITRKGLAELAHRTQEWTQFSGAVNAIILGG